MSIQKDIPWPKRQLHYLDIPKDKWLAILVSGLFCSLFLLYFKPYGINNYDPNFEMDFQFVVVVFSVGLVIILTLTCTEFLLRPVVIRTWNYSNAILWMLLVMVILSSVVFFYYNWLGDWHDMRFSSYLSFIPNVSLLGVFSVGAMVLYFEYKGVKSAYELSLNERTTWGTKVYFNSANQKEQVVLFMDQLLYLEAQDNYVAIYFLNKDKIEKALIRNSLRNILDNSSALDLCQCHRSFVVNLNQIIHVSGNNHGLELKLNRLEKSLPVSRKFVAKVRERLEDMVSCP